MSLHYVVKKETTSTLQNPEKFRKTWQERAYRRYGKTHFHLCLKLKEKIQQTKSALFQEVSDFE